MRRRDFADGGSGAFRRMATYVNATFDATSRRQTADSYLSLFLKPIFSANTAGEAQGEKSLRAEWRAARRRIDLVSQRFVPAHAKAAAANF